MRLVCLDLQLISTKSEIEKLASMLLVLDFDHIGKLPYGSACQCPCWAAVAFKARQTTCIDTYTYIHVRTEYTRYTHIQSHMRMHSLCGNVAACLDWYTQKLQERRHMCSSVVLRAW